MVGSALVVNQAGVFYAWHLLARNTLRRVLSRQFRECHSFSHLLLPCTPGFGAHTHTHTHIRIRIALTPARLLWQRHIGICFRRHLFLRAQCLRHVLRCTANYLGRSARWLVNQLATWSFSVSRKPSYAATPRVHAELTMAPNPFLACALWISCFARPRDADSTPNRTPRGGSTRKVNTRGNKHRHSSVFCPNHTPFSLKLGGARTK